MRFRSPRPGAATGLWLALGFCLLVTRIGSAADLFGAATEKILSGDHRAALAEYEAFLQSHPRDPLAPMAAVAAAQIRRLALEDVGGAVELYDRVLVEYGSSPWAREAARRKGESLEAQEQWAAAGAAYRQALALVPGQEAPQVAPTIAAARSDEAAVGTWLTEVSLAAANCFYQAGDREQMITTYENLIARGIPPQAEATALYRLGESYEAAGQAHRAARWYARVIKRHPLSTEFAPALSKRATIEPHEPLSWDAYEALAAARDSLRQFSFDGALRLSRQASTACDDPAVLHSAEYIQIIATAVPRADFQGAITRLQALQAKMSSGSNRVVSGTIRAYEQAVAMQSLTRGASRSAETLSGLAMRYFGMGAYERAVETFQEALQLTPDDTMMLNLVGYTLINLGRPEEAIEYFKRVVSLDPEDPNAYDSLAEGYLRAGRPEESIREYQRSIATDPTFANPHFMLAGIYRDRDEVAKAVASYERFIELSESGNPLVAQARAALAELQAENNQDTGQTVR